MTRAIATTEHREVKTRAALERGLNARQKAFAQARARGYSRTQSVDIAGYECTTQASKRSFGHILEHDEQIARLIAYYARVHLASLTGEAVKTVADVMRNGKDDADRLRASKEILNRGGAPASQEYDVNVSGTVDHRPALTMNDLRARAGLPSLPEKPSLTRPDPENVVDAEFTQVEPSAGNPFAGEEW